MKPHGPFSHFVLITPILSLLLFVSSTANAETLLVPEQYCLRKALADARSGDTVLVNDGVYSGHDSIDLYFKGKQIILRSVNGPKHTIIDLKNDYRWLTLNNGEREGTVVDGFTVINGWVRGRIPPIDYGGAIQISNASVTIRNCIFKNNKARTYGGAISINASPLASIENCTFIGNRADAGGAISIDYIYDRYHPTGKPPNHYFDGPTIRNCTFKNNQRGLT